MTFWTRFQLKPLSHWHLVFQEGNCTITFSLLWKYEKKNSYVIQKLFTLHQEALNQYPTYITLTVSRYFDLSPNRKVFLTCRSTICIRQVLKKHGRQRVICLFCRIWKFSRRNRIIQLFHRKFCLHPLQDWQSTQDFFALSFWNLGRFGYIIAIFWASFPANWEWLHDNNQEDDNGTDQ